MLLIGMLDSPYVRRVAISLQLLGLSFEHRPLSVFRNFDAFAEINPVVKAPTLVCDDGTVLMDSTLMLEYAQALAGAKRRLAPGDPRALASMLRQLGLALAACDKAVQIVYERTLRPTPIQHRPWLDRVSGQLHAACRALDDELEARPLPVSSDHIDHAGVAIAVAWQFVRMTIPDVFTGLGHPALDRHREAAERLPEFAAAPYGDGTCTAGQG